MALIEVPHGTLTCLLEATVHLGALIRVPPLRLTLLPVAVLSPMMQAPASRLISA